MDLLDEENSLTHLVNRPHSLESFCHAAIKTPACVNSKGQGLECVKTTVVRKECKRHLDVNAQRSTMAEHTQDRDTGCMRGLPLGNTLDRGAA